MKKVITQILKALAYFAVYFIPLNIIVFISQFIYGYVESRKMSAAGASVEEITEYVQANVGNATVIALLITSVLVILTYFIIEKVKKTSLAKEADIRKASGKQIIFTVIGAVGGMFFLNFILLFLPIPQEMMSTLQNGLTNISTSSLVLGIITNSILVPVMEEIVFRGYIFSRLEKAMPSIVAAIISSVIFGLCHGSLLWAIWAATVGMIICVVRIKSGSIVPGMIFHIIINSFATITNAIPAFNDMTEPVLIALTVIGGILLAVYFAGILTDKSSAKKKADVSVTSVKA